MSGQCESYKQGWFVVQGDSWLHRKFLSLMAAFPLSRAEIELLTWQRASPSRA